MLEKFLTQLTIVKLQRRKSGDFQKKDLALDNWQFKELSYVYIILIA